MRCPRPEGLGEAQQHLLAARELRQRHVCQVAQGEGAQVAGDVVLGNGNTEAEPCWLNHEKKWGVKQEE